jgi:hypothetical protein
LHAHDNVDQCLVNMRKRLSVARMRPNDVMEYENRPSVPHLGLTNVTNELRETFRVEAGSKRLEAIGVSAYPSCRIRSPLARPRRCDVFCSQDRFEAPQLLIGRPRTEVGYIARIREIGSAERFVPACKGAV